MGGAHVVQMRTEDATDDAAMQEAEDGDPGSAEDFFARLPSDSFSPDEEGLREAVLSFLEAQKGEPAACSLVEADKVVGRLLGKVLRKGCPVSFREWIDRRLGGEIDTGED